MRPPRSGIAARIWPGTSNEHNAFAAVAASCGPISGRFAADRGFAPSRLNGCGKGAAKDAAEAATAAIPVQVERPTARRDALRLRRHSAAAGGPEATVVAKVEGEVREVLVEEGERVKAGQVLARLDGDRLRFELQQTEVNMRKLERDYQRKLELFSRKLVALRRRRQRPVRDGVAEGGLRPGAACNSRYTEIRAPIAGMVSAPRRQGRQHHQRQRPHASWSRTSTR